VVRRLGAGGFARVYQARDPDLEIDVAVKLLRAELALDADTVDKFRREASMAARLRHPNVITVLMVGRLPDAFDGAPPGTPYLVMDYLPTSLADRLTGAGTLAPEDVARVGAEVARGLAFAHRAGIIHRDVKPENILFASDGRAVVTDFGIARAVAGSPTAASRQVLLGTPDLLLARAGARAAARRAQRPVRLGVTLFRAATGVLPFPGEDWYDVMRQHVEAQPPRVRALAPRARRPRRGDRALPRQAARRSGSRPPTSSPWRSSARAASARAGR
jgi:serine/threonine-protein kinase